MLTERMQILIRPDQRRRLESEAERRGTSVAALIREALDAQLGAVSAAERHQALEHIRTIGGRFLTPDELNQLSRQERDAEATAILTSGGQ